MKVPRFDALSQGIRKVSDCHIDLSRRNFLRTVAGVALAVSGCTQETDTERTESIKKRKEGVIEKIKKLGGIDLETPIIFKGLEFKPLEFTEEEWESPTVFPGIITRKFWLKASDQNLYIGISIDEGHAFFVTDLSAKNQRDKDPFKAVEEGVKSLKSD